MIVLQLYFHFKINFKKLNTVSCSKKGLRQSVSEHASVIAASLELEYDEYCFMYLVHKIIY